MSVVVTENLYGDILSDLASGLIGGLGLTASANIGEGGIAMFEAVHGSAPDIAGRNMANPIAMTLSAGLMLAHMGLQDCADKLRGGVEKVLASGSCITRDLGGEASTTEVTAAIIAAM